MKCWKSCVEHSPGVVPTAKAKDPKESMPWSWRDAKQRSDKPMSFERAWNWAFESRRAIVHFGGNLVQSLRRKWLLKNDGKGNETKKQQQKQRLARASSFSLQASSKEPTNLLAKHCTHVGKGCWGKSLSRSYVCDKARPQINLGWVGSFMRCNRWVSLCFTGNLWTLEKQCSASSTGKEGTFSTSESSLRDEDEEPEDELDESSSWTSFSWCSSGGSAWPEVVICVFSEVFKC